MSSCVVVYKLKIKQLLEKFLQSKCPIEIYIYLDRFLSHLSRGENADIESSLISLPIFTEWITRAVTTWSSHGTTPSTNVACFILNVASLLSKNETKFCLLNTNNFFIKLINVCKARQPEVAPSVKLAYIKLLSSFLEHKSGIEWMTVCTFWEDVLELCLTDESIQITKDGQGFMSKILEKAFNHDENFCVKVVERIIWPAIGITNMPFQDFRLTAELVGNILEYFLEGMYLDQKDSRVALRFLGNYQLKDKISVSSLAIRNRSVFFQLKKIVFILHFLELHVKVTSNDNEANVRTSVREIMDLFVSTLSNGNFEDFLKFCDFGVLYWNLMGSKILRSQDNTNEAIAFAHQLIILPLLPNHCLQLKYCFSLLEMEEFDDDFRDDFVQKLTRTMCPQLLRLVYIWQDFLIAQPMLFEISIKSLKCAINSLKYCPKERGVTAFQFLMYVLKDIVAANREFSEKLGIFLKETSYFSLLFEVLVIFVEKFSITWEDSVESIEVIDVCFDFLSLSNWPSEVVVEVLKLMNVAISKCMSPNLALLIDRTQDSTVALLGPLLYSKLRSNSWKVKDQALEIVVTVARMSKFPSLQKVLMDSELPTLVVKMSTCDGESFVRATAIKCLQEMIQVEEIWNNALASENLSEKMREILLNETEGIVRVEAATFMCIAYEQQQFPRDSLDRIYETMIHSSTTDLHWEVKVRALGFWDKVIKNHLQNQGMIDGTFPNVTFSKEHRKIVTLTDSEIRKRLQKVLNQLSAIGCLGVLVSAIKDDCDMEVSKTAVKITQHLVELFKKYNLYGDHSSPTSPQPTENGLSSSMSVSSGISVDDAMDSPASYNPEFNDEIIDQIVNSKDVCLLKHVYSPSDYGSVSNYDIQVRKIVTPNEFLHYTQQDLNNIIQEKKNWLNGIEDLGSLLDDMLKTYDDDVNNMDCY